MAVAGKEVQSTQLDPAKREAVNTVRGIFDKLKRAMKTIALYRHNTERYSEYFQPVYDALAQYLARTSMLQLRVEALSYKLHGEVVFEDDSRENNLIYSLWQAGVRLLIIKQGLPAEELLKFFLICMGDADINKRRSEDIVTQLWKAELNFIEYIVVESFKAAADEDAEDVEIEVEKVVAYLYRQLQSNSADYMRFARISASDLELQLNDVDQVRGAVVQGITATEKDKDQLQRDFEDETSRNLQKMVVILLQLIELDTTEGNFEDIAEAFVQLLDALLLARDFRAIQQVRARFLASVQKPSLTPEARQLIKRCSDRFQARMAEEHRLQIVGQSLNGNIEDAEGVRSYLINMPPEAVPTMLDILETLQALPSRRLLSDVLAEVGKNSTDLFVGKMQNAPSNLVKDLLYIVDKINPPNKFKILSAVLTHPNAILRLETLGIIGRNNAPECFDQLRKVISEGTDPQMRAQALRFLSFQDDKKASPLLMQIVKNEALVDKMSDIEKKALFAAITQTNSPDTEAYVRSVLDAKSGLFAKKRVDEMKYLVIGGLESVPSVPALQVLADIVKDNKKHSKEVCEAARAAAINVKTKLLGG